MHELLCRQAWYSQHLLRHVRFFEGAQLQLKTLNP